MRRKPGMKKFKASGAQKRRSNASLEFSRMNTKYDHSESRLIWPPTPGDVEFTINHEPDVRSSDK